MPARTYAASCVIDIALSCACSVPELPTHDTRAHGRRLLGLLTRVSFPLSLPGGQAPPPWLGLYQFQTISEGLAVAFRL